MDDKPRAPWEQQPQETTEAYEAATIFFDLGPRRTFAETARRLGRSRGYVRNLATRHQWKERAQACDRHHQQARRNKRKEEPVEPAATPSPLEEANIWEQRLSQQREIEWNVAQELIARVRDMLATPLEEMRWSPRDVATYFNLAMQLVRYAASEGSEGGAGAEGKAETVIRVEYVGEETNAETSGEEDATTETDETDETDETSETSSDEGNKIA